MSSYLLIVKADTNDADYIEGTTIVDETELETIKVVLAAIKAGRHSHNWPRHEYVDETPEELYPELTEKQIDMFSDCVPRGENGTHSVDSVEYYEVIGDKVSLF